MDGNGAPGDTSFIPLLRDAPFAVIVCEMDGHVIAVNAKAHRLLGSHADRLEGRSVDRLLAEKGAWRHLLDQLGKATALESVPVTIAGGTPMLMGMQRLGEGVAQPIALYPRAIDPAEVEMTRLRYMVESLSEVIWELDADFNFIYVSPRILKMRGRAPAEYIGHNLREVLPTEYSEMMISAARSKAAKERMAHRPLNTRLIEQLPDGTKVWTEITAVPIIKDGKIAGFFGSSRDVTEQKAVEDALVEAKGRLEATLKALPDMHFEVNAEDKIVWYNMAGAASPYLGMPELKAPEVLSTDGLKALDQAREEADRMGRGVFQYSLPTPEGQRYFEAYVSPVPGTPPSHLFAVRDITAMREITEALRQANQRISLMGHITRHDMINSMTVAEGNLRLCLDDIDSPKLPERLQKAAKALREMGGLMAFYREYQEGGRGESSWHDLARIARLEGQILEAAGIALQVEDGLEVRADPMFRKVVRNLLENVSKHSASATECRITYRPVEDEVEVSIEDNGGGIPDKYRARLFQRGQGSNTGLGLYLSREILSMDGISIDEASSPGQGARFVLRIPRGRYRIQGGRAHGL